MNAWIEQWFDADIAYQGGIIRRKISSVEKNASFDELLSAVKAMGWHLIETGDQYVVICNAGNFKLHC